MSFCNDISAALPSTVSCSSNDDSLLSTDARVLVVNRDQAIYQPGYAPDRQAIADLAKTGITQLMIYSLTDAITGTKPTETTLIGFRC